MNIYCVPREPGSVAWSTLLNALAEQTLVRAPYRAGAPFPDDTSRSNVRRPENWIVPETLGASKSSLPLRDFERLADALAYVHDAADATVTMDAPESSFRSHPDPRGFSGAVALYRFRDGAPFRIGVPPDFSDLAERFPDLANQSTLPKWEGTLTELLWLHGKCVPPKDEFIGSPLDELLRSFWPGYRVLADEFL